MIQDRHNHVCMHTCTFTGNAAAARKAERELSPNLGKENQEEAAPKKRKVDTLTLTQKAKHLSKTPPHKSNKKRKPLGTTQNYCPTTPTSVCSLFLTKHKTWNGAKEQNRLSLVL